MMLMTAIMNVFWFRFIISFPSKRLSNRIHRLLIHLFDRLQQKIHIGERLSAGALPMNTPIGVDKDGRVQFDFLEVVIGREAPRIVVIMIGEQAQA
jgi:hypothetical protein